MSVSNEVFCVQIVYKDQETEQERAVETPSQEPGCEISSPRTLKSSPVSSYPTSPRNYNHVVLRSVFICFV